jgi:hypothetical protein
MVVSTETAGLGNRLKSWMSAWRLDPQACVYWPITPNMPAAFSDLFENDCEVDSVPEGATEIRSWRLAVLPADEADLPKRFSPVNSTISPIWRGLGKLAWSVRGRRDDRYKYMIFPKTQSKRSTRRDGRHVDLEYERIPESVRERYRPLFAGIRLRRDLLAATEDFAADNIDTSTIGVQIRTWRDDPRRHVKYHRTSLERLHRLIGGAARDRRLLVVSDDDGMVHEISRRYGRDRVIFYPRRTPRAQSWQSSRGVAEDLVDLLVLARTNQYFASYLSTFSEAAWWLGGARAEVEVF